MTNFIEKFEMLEESKQHLHAIDHYRWRGCNRGTPPTVAVPTVAAPVPEETKIRDLVDDVITVEDNEIIEAIRLCYEILKVAVEPGGAIGLAAILSDNFKKNPAWRACKNIGIILSGGHVYLGVLWDSFIKWKLKCLLHRNQILGDIYF
ncbi:hypothetical protein Q3G72_009622 [Acer saccharum]|nr:hypothetical protein Q3G72_009622 [Acer saccharum]